MVGESTTQCEWVQPILWERGMDGPGLEARTPHGEGCSYITCRGNRTWAVVACAGHSPILDQPNGSNAQDI